MEVEPEMDPTSIISAWIYLAWKPPCGHKVDWGWVGDTPRVDLGVGRRHRADLGGVYKLSSLAPSAPGGNFSDKVTICFGNV